MLLLVVVGGFGSFWLVLAGFDLSNRSRYRYGLLCQYALVIILVSGKIY